MRKYEGQAAKYRRNANDINSILEKVMATTTDVQSLLDRAYLDAKNDYFTNKINENNETVEEDVKEIGKKINGVADSLDDEATRLDDEEEAAAKKALEEQEETNETTNS